MKIEISQLKAIENQFNKEELSEEFANYLINKSKLQNENILKITISGPLKTEEKKEIEKRIHNHFNILYQKWNNIDKYDNYFRLLLLILGIILILISEQLLSVFRELFLIAGWVVVWEIIYDELFSQIKRKRTKNIYKRLATCEINYSKENRK